MPFVGIKSALDDDKNTLDRDTDLRRSIPVWPRSSAIFSVSDLCTPTEPDVDRSPARLPSAEGQRAN